MGLWQTGTLYLLIGLVVGAASCLREGAGRDAVSFLRAALSAIFWPIFLPLLLGGPPTTGQKTAQAPDADAGLDPRVQRAEDSLLLGLSQLDGMAEGLAHPEVARIRELGASLHCMSGRLREMDRLLGSPEFDAGRAKGLLWTWRAGASPRRTPVSPACAPGCATSSACAPCAPAPPNSWSGRCSRWRK